MARCILHNQQDNYSIRIRVIIDNGAPNDKKYTILYVIVFRNMKLFSRSYFKIRGSNDNLICKQVEENTREKDINEIILGINKYVSLVPDISCDFHYSLKKLQKQGR